MAFPFPDVRLSKSSNGDPPKTFAKSNPIGTFENENANIPLIEHPFLCLMMIQPAISMHGISSLGRGVGTARSESANRKLLFPASFLKLMFVAFGALFLSRLTLSKLDAYSTSFSRSVEWVLTTWSDGDIIRILKNCYKALPEGGKVIACEPVLPETTDESHRTRALLSGDIFVMTIYRAKGKHRTEGEYTKLGITAGFPRFKAVYIDYFFTILEFQK